ncbi:MAG: MASE1 domain-containing protein [Candidatus Marinimicrobia bacterium]|nr:MASE1 domain-containing protein [Candidatus Neomarinimicrobiota bacterium]
MTYTSHLSAQEKPAFSEMRIPLLVYLALIAGAYFASVRLGLLFAVQPEGIASIWPPSGVALSALLLSDRRKWILILLVILTVNVAGNLTGGNSLVVSLGFGLVNALEGGLIAVVITRVLGYQITFSRAFEVVVFFGIVAVSNAFTALFGAAVPVLAFGAPFFDTWVVWWISDALGMILITPFILTMATNPSLISTMRSYKAYVERIVLLSAIVLVTWFLSSGTSHSLINFYLIFPLLMWSAFRFGPRGTASTLLLFTFVALGMIVYANSWFGITLVSVKESLLSMQILVFIAALSSMTLAAVVTKRKQAEAALAQSDSLRELLLDIITHDLKNPAGVIYALSETARKKMPENEFLEAIYTSSGRLIEVLTQTTLLSQAAFGETIPKESLSLNTLLKETVDDLASALSAAEMECVVAIAPNLIIEANPLITEVFKNYISNAIKYASDGEKIVIESILEEQTVIVCVKDLGKTIAEADRDQIFQRRIQLENGKEKGRGLGLAIVKRIALAHDGEVWVEPNTPQGNSFCLRIPL